MVMKMDSNKFIVVIRASRKYRIVIIFEVNIYTEQKQAYL